MIRRVGNPPERGRTYRQRTGVYAILPLGRRILLTAQTDPQLDIQLPGGGVDPGETALHALHREVMEETGWSLARPRRLGAFRRFVYMPEYGLWAEKLCHVYLAHPARRITKDIEAGHMTLMLSSAEAVAMLGNEGDRLFLTDFLRR